MRAAFGFWGGRPWNARAMRWATALAATSPRLRRCGASRAPIVVIDPFAGSCNTLYWILRHIPDASGIACEFDPQVHALTKANIAQLDQEIALIQGDYQSMLTHLDVPPGRDLIAFVAPPWSTALDESLGLDPRRTAPPIIDIVQSIASRSRDRRILFAIQVYENLNMELARRSAGRLGLVRTQYL